MRAHPRWPCSPGLRSLAEEATASATGEMLRLEVSISQDGYLYAYVSNESNWDAPVLFDEMQARLTEQLTVVDRQDYYPFGATHESLAPNPTNRYLYQGKELTNNLGLGLYDFHARQYDPYLGRFTSIDPAASSWAGVSPYAGMLNNPISYVDPDGRNPIIIGIMIGGTAGFGIGYASGLRGNELLASTLGGAALGAGIGFGANGGFAGFGQGVGGVLANAPGAAANLAQRVFSGVGPTVGMDMATRAASSIIAGPFTQPGLLVDDYGLSHLDYGASYQPSQYAGMNIMQYHQAKTSDGFWNDPVTQGVIELATLPLPVPKLGMGKLFGRLAAKGGMQYTKSSLSLGRQMHTGYKAGLADGVTTFKEFTGIKGIRPDFVDFGTKTIYELKPFNPRSIQLGTKQLNNYKSIFEREYPGTIWKTVLDHY